MTRPDPDSTARTVHREKHPGARTLFLAGSVIRGESTPHSDLDIVVVYDRLQHAYRESFLLEGWPVETFVHDPDTLAYFFAEDVRLGRPCLPSMVAEGVEIPNETHFGQQWKTRARQLLDAGPAPLDTTALRRFRYGLGDLLDDLRTPRSHAEALATGAALYGQVAEFWFRSQGAWSAAGKSIPRGMRQRDAAFADRFETAFAMLFAEGEPAAVIALAEELLHPFGGPLFDGFRLDAPAEWRRDTES